MKKILGYSDKISVCPGDTISFMVSCEEGGSYDASVVRIIHGDTHPDGPGFKSEPVATSVDGSYKGRHQEVLAGSYVMVADDARFDRLRSFTVQMMIWPTTPGNGPQSLLARWDETKRCGFKLGIDANRGLCLTIGDGKGNVDTVSSGKPLLAREWYFVAASFDADKGEARIYQEPSTTYAKIDDRATLSGPLSSKLGNPRRPLLMAAHFVEEVNGRIRTAEHYNGKIDSPILTDGVLDRVEMGRLIAGDGKVGTEPRVIARWDFSRDMTSDVVRDVSPNRLDGSVINMPARAMKGYNWSGREMCWLNAPQEYAAIHFHDDDLYDSGWDVDFRLTIPDSMQSGIYAAHVHKGEHEDHIPFVVRPRSGARTADIVFLVPTASYMAYANEHMASDAPIAELLTGQIPVLYPQDVFLLENRNYGGSCYDVHSDGSGICYSSRLRPILNMRPKYQSWLGGAGSSLWQFNADTHITDWLEAKGYKFDCVTDEDLHFEGLAALEGYKVVITGSHPEYWSKEMWDALDAYKERGGRLMYLGANGWYWRIAYHETRPGVMEVRRAEDGIRAWAAEPGEYYHSFTGEFGGLWRRQGRPPQMMAGTGFTAQGFDVCSYFRRKPDSYDPRAKFIFEGVNEEIIGDFGLIGGGAAGLELDRADRLLGTPPNALVLASSENHTDVYLVVCEEILINHPGLCGQESELVRADMVFYETPAGGAVFSTSSIAWGGSLSHNGYSNSVSRITANVLTRFLDETSF